MPLVEQLYCTQQINVPPTLPTILKQFCKAAIRTQPYDLLKWSSAYFRALAEGEEPPIKLRLEYPPPSTESGLTLGFLKVLHRQFGDYNKNLSLDTIAKRWDGLCLDSKDLELIISIGGFRKKCQVKKFLSIGVSLLSSSLHETMIIICELFTHEPDGGSAMIPLKLFMELYGYLAGLEYDGNNDESSDMYLSDINKQDIVRKHLDDDSSKSEKDISEKLGTETDLKRKRIKHEAAIVQRRPRVPGIGPRLTPESIQSVAIWMTECASLQEGMVGPRNLRHFQCPLLDEPESQQKELTD